jgi:Domain of unknown function (DUF4124)
MPVHRGFHEAIIMKSIIAWMTLGLFAAALGNAAQLYRWVDAKGNVEWRDTPPPASAPAKNVEQRRVGGNVIETSDAPYSVQLAAKNHPVTLWGSSDCGKICEGARAHLARRGVPFAEKNPQSDNAGFNKVSPAHEVPILQVGVITLKGYLESEWDSTLDNAGYPRTGIAAKPKPAAPPAAAPPAAAPPVAVPPAYK